MEAKTTKKSVKESVWTREEISKLMKNAAKNIDNLQHSFRVTSFELQTHTAQACEYKYYSIRRGMKKYPTLSRVLKNKGFFMLSRYKLYIQGKNSTKTNYLPDCLNPKRLKEVIKGLSNE